MVFEAVALYLLPTRDFSPSLCRRSILARMSAACNGNTQIIAQTICLGFVFMQMCNRWVELLKRAHFYSAVLSPGEFENVLHTTAYSNFVQGTDAKMGI